MNLVVMNLKNNLETIKVFACIWSNISGLRLLTVSTFEINISYKNPIKSKSNDDLACAVLGIFSCWWLRWVGVCMNLLNSMSYAQNEKEKKKNQINTNKATPIIFKLEIEWPKF